MCGIIGTLDWSGQHPPDVGLLRQMLGIIRHRGPDEFGLYVDQKVGIGCARLSIIDLSTGQQPIANEDDTLWIVFNGEIYNYLELRAELDGPVIAFSTRSDTEVILHLYEELGPSVPGAAQRPVRHRHLGHAKEDFFLARDRVGIRPLFYAPLPQGLVFGSEIKAIAPGSSRGDAAGSITPWPRLSPSGLPWLRAPSSRALRNFLRATICR